MEGSHMSTGHGESPTVYLSLMTNYPEQWDAEAFTCFHLSDAQLADRRPKGERRD